MRNEWVTAGGSLPALVSMDEMAAAAAEGCAPSVIRVTHAEQVRPLWGRAPARGLPMQRAGQGRAVSHGLGAARVGSGLRACGPRRSAQRHSGALGLRSWPQVNAIDRTSLVSLVRARLKVRRYGGARLLDGAAGCRAHLRGAGLTCGVQGSPAGCRAHLRGAGLTCGVQGSPALPHTTAQEKTCQAGEYLFRCARAPSASPAPAHALSRARAAPVCCARGLTHARRGARPRREGEEAHCVFMVMSGVVELTQHLHRPPGPAPGEPPGGASGGASAASSHLAAAQAPRTRSRAHSRAQASVGTVGGGTEQVSSGGSGSGGGGPGAAVLAALAAAGGSGGGEGDASFRWERSPARATHQRPKGKAKKAKPKASARLAAPQRAELGTRSTTHGRGGALQASRRARTCPPPERSWLPRCPPDACPAPPSQTPSPPPPHPQRGSGRLAHTGRPGRRAHGA
jgi:hypothetical protein